MSRIAVVEDDALIRELWNEVLTSRGYEVDEYGSVGEAHTGLSARDVDLVLLDVGLPDGNGLELLRRLDPETRPPAIVLSGHGAECDLNEGYEAGAVDYLTKPVRPAELLAKCARWLAGPKPAPTSTRVGRELPGGRHAAFGAFDVEEELGHGGTGVVYRARILKTGEPVALKVLTVAANTSEEARQRMLRESFALSLVRHPNLGRLLDFGAQEGRLYCAMELVSGMTLAQKVARDGPATEEEARQLLAGMAAGIEALAGAGLVHRDIKPANVMLRGGCYADPVIIDFGLAKRPQDRSLTQEGILLGTPGFMAPEQILNHDVGVQTDLFSAGLATRFALTGQGVFPDATGIALLTCIATRPIPIPFELSASFRALLRSLTRIRVKQRPATAGEVLQALLEDSLRAA